MSAADPFSEIRITRLHATRGANFWSQRPVTRMDIAIGAYEDIASADVPGFTEALLRAMPGLAEHRCSIGEPGGFVVRLRRGTYAPHIIEHVALELQTMIGHEVGYGKTRGGDVEGEYTLVFEHRHDAVGLRAGALALDIVQRTFAGQLDPEWIQHATAELAALAQAPDAPAPRQQVLCAITGGRWRAETRDELVRRGIRGDDLIVDVAPSFILQAGLPYARSEIGVVLDAEPVDVPERYQDRERAQQLVSTIADGVAQGGILIAPAKEWEIQDYARRRGCRVAIFSTGDDVTRRDAKVARAVAQVREGRIRIEYRDEVTDAGPLASEVPAVAQVAGALAVFTLRELQPVQPAAHAAG